MNGIGSRSRSAITRRNGAVVLLLTAVLFATMGLSCGDIPYVSGTFRDASIDQISAGVKDIVNGILDGIFAVLQSAGDGPGSSGTN
jgi:hypothetical protein